VPIATQDHTIMQVLASFALTRYLTVSDAIVELIVQFALLVLLVRTA
jgi:hypothetical protein